jgi:hypothetical protein
MKIMGERDDEVQAAGPGDDPFPFSSSFVSHNNIHGWKRSHFYCLLSLADDICVRKKKN